MTQDTAASKLDSAARSAIKARLTDPLFRAIILFIGSNRGVTSVFHLIAASEKCFISIGWRRGRVAEGGGLLNRYTL